MEEKIIYSLFDYSGNWVKPYKQAGYIVRQIDLKYGDDVRLLEVSDEKIYGVLAAPPCTDFSVSGSQYWKDKDKDGRTLSSLELLGATARFILASKPEFWCLENPVGRLPRYFGKYSFIFNPYEFGGWLAPGEKSHELYPEQDKYSKKTCLWGRFNIPEKKVVEPIWMTTTSGKRFSVIGWSTGGKSERTKEIRSITPLGFSRAFFEANR